MPEIYRDKKETISQYEGEKDFKKKYAKLARKITDNAKSMVLGVNAESPEYWGLREILTEEEVDVLLTLKLRKYGFETVGVDSPITMTTTVRRRKRMSMKRDTVFPISFREVRSCSTRRSTGSTRIRLSHRSSNG